MADNLQTIVNFDGIRRHEVTLTSISDGTGESNSTKVAGPAMTVFDSHANRDVPVTGLTVEGIEWSITGFTRVEIFWDDDVEDNYIAVLSGGGRDTNGLQTGTSEGKMYFGDTGLVNPSGTIGNINFTTYGNVDGDSYTIRLILRKKH